MKTFTKEDIKKLVFGVYDGMSKEDCLETLEGIIGTKGKFIYNAVPEVQKDIEKIASELSFIKTKEKWNSVEDGRKAFAWHIYINSALFYD